MNQLIDKILTLCTSTDPHRGVLTGRHFKQDADGLHVVTTDAHRLARYTDPTQASEVETRITRDSSGMPMDGKYPTLERVIPDPNEATRTFELPVEALREILLSLKPFAKCAANRVVLSFSAGLVTATVKRDDLKAFACTPAVRGTFAYREATPKQDGEEFAIALNCLYLLDLLPVARRGLRVPELIRLRCKKASTPVLVDYPNMETLDWDRLTCVIMPMSLD